MEPVRPARSQPDRYPLKGKRYVYEIDPVLTDLTYDARTLLESAVSRVLLCRKLGSFRKLFEHGQNSKDTVKTRFQHREWAGHIQIMIINDSSMWDQRGIQKR